MAVKISTESFEKEVLQSNIPAIVDFWAPWCGPCKMIAPALDQLSKEYSGKIKVCNLNVDDSPEIATQYTVMSIPAIFLFKDGQIMEKRVGAMNFADLKKFIQPYL